MRSVLASTRPSLSASRPVRNNLALLSLPGLCCQAAGGAQSRAGAEDIAAAWCLLSRTAHLLDHIADGEVEARLASAFSPGQILNIAIGLMTSASLALCALGGSEAAHIIRRDFYQSGLKMCAGQHADLTVREPTLEHCWQIAEAKSGEFFALACRAGARLACEDTARLALFGEFGQHLGVLLQIADDISGLWAWAEERSDLATGGKWTLPVAYAMTVLATSKRDELGRYLKAASTEANAEAEARRLIVESGALLYLIVETERRQRRAEATLTAAAPPSAARDELLALLHQSLPRVNR